ncbi:PAS/PAC sensor hybrid histidine kinase [Bryocella elongata]|uniref:histidine kinase n=1 Tax=Bryocella elongata TaxID=863522 RepID=A0A1H6C2I2_9BACT|nr:PAS domain S-box protein [Bryocella elongata]SEG66907.1 PAS/PAC sensor hybrid histidine kinase [Bryocella elongata]
MPSRQFVTARSRDLATALLCAGSALLVHLALRQFLGPLPPYLTFYPAVAVAALLSGVWSGFFSGIFCGLCAYAFLVPPSGSVVFSRATTGIAFATFVVTASAMAWLVTTRTRRESVAATKARAEADASAMQLAQANARLQAVFDNLEEGVLFVDASGAGVTANAAVTRILGVSAAAFANPATDPRAHSLDEQGRVMALTEIPSARVIVSGESVTDVRMNLPDASGNRHWLKVNARPLRASDGTIAGAVTSFSDITASKLAEDELKANRDRLELLIENAPVGLAMFDRQMRYMKVSRRFLEDFDLVGRNVIGLGHYDVFPDLPSSLRSIHQLALEGEQHDCNAEPFRRPDGSTQWIRWQIYPWRDVNGAVSGVILFTEDITAQRKAQAHLEATEERFRKAFLLSPFPVILINWDTGVVIDANEAQLTLMDRRREEVIGRSTPDYEFWVDPERREQLRQAVTNLGSVKDFRMKFRRGDGEIRDGVIDAQQLEISGQPCVVNVTRDVTDELRLEQQTADLQKTQAIGRLAGGLAHDFNNLLGVITAATEQAESGPTAQLDTQLDRIRTAASRATELTGQLLALSNHDAAFPRDLDLNEVLQQLRQRSESTDPTSCRVKLVPDQKPALIHADPTLIERALLTLTAKAREASGDRHVVVSLHPVQFTPETARVLHPACRARSYYAISVTDSGPGMSPEQIERIFEPFGATRPGMEGDGLGYAAVQGIALQCGGFVDAHSEMGHGTTFTLYLPTLHAEPRAAVEPVVPPPPPVQELEAKPVVLVVEDNAPLRELTVEMLCEAGFQILEADSAESAMELISRDKPRIDLLLTDVIMPGRNGVELHGDLATTYPTAKVLFMSGYPSDVLQGRNSAATEHTFLQKPFNRKKLLAKVNSILNGEISAAHAPNPPRIKTAF